MPKWKIHWQFKNDILTDWFGNPQTTTDTLLFRNFPTVSLFSNTVETVASGDWADSNVWTVGRMPFANEFVRIRPGHTVNVGQSITVRNIKLDGKLKFLGPYKVKLTG